MPQPQSARAGGERLRELHRFFSFSFLLILIVFVVGGMPAAAQCNPSVDPDCIGNNDGLGPDVSISPDGETYQGSPGVPVEVPVTIVLTDRDVLAEGTLAVKLTNSRGWETVPGWSWEPTGNGTHVIVRGKLALDIAGDNVITATAKDRFGNIGGGTATFKVEHADPTLPIIYTDAHHNDYKSLTQSQVTVDYGLPAYTSLGVQRAVTLVYSSELASPNAYVQLDVRPGLQGSQGVVALSLQIIDQAANRIVAREYFWARDPGGQKQRLALLWSMRAKPTGAYMYWAAVRSYWADGSYKEKRIPVRVLIVNESKSRYGAGWTFAGVQRIYGVTGGLILTDGEGVARWYASAGCDAAQCFHTTPEGDFTKVTYERASGTLTRTYTDGATVRFDSRGLMTHKTDRYGRTTTYVWQNTADAQPVPVLQKIVDPMQKAITFTYSPAGYLFQITDPANRVHTFTHTNGDLTAISGTTPFAAAYNSVHLLESYTDEQGTWDVNFYRGTFSSLTAPAVVANGVQSRPSVKYLRAEWLTTLLATQGTGLGNLAPSLPAENAVLETVDALGHKTRTRNDRFGQPVKIVDAAGNVTTFSYTKDGLPASTVEPNLRTTLFDWNDRGQLLSKRVGDAVVYQASYSRTDLPDFELADGRALWKAYGAHGELLRSWFGTEGDWQKNGTVFTYDELFRPTVQTGPKGERTEWGYGGNEWGNVSFMMSVLEGGSANTSRYGYDGAGRIVSTIDGLGRTTLASFDTRNRARTITRPDGAVEKLDYTGGLLTQITDGAGKIQLYAYNALGWLDSTRYPDGRITSYTYDLDGMPLARTDRRGLTVRMTYDVAHRLATRVADGVTTTFTYPNAATTAATNDVATLTTSMLTAIGTAQTDRVSISFAGLPERLYELKSVYDANWTPIGTDLHTYLRGTIASKSSIRRVFEQGSAGLNLAVTDASGRTTSVAFDVAGRLVQTTFPNGVAQQNGYATDGRLVSTRFTGAEANERFGTDYFYDTLGRVTMRHLPYAGTRWTYGYDTTGRLSSFQQATLSDPIGCDPSVETCLPNWRTSRSDRYTYDAAHNRTDSNSAVAAVSNRYTSFAGYTLEYDAEGNLTRKYRPGFDQRLTWSALNQLTSVTTNGVVVRYGYDPLGRRVTRTADGVTTYAIYDDAALIMELDSRGETVRTYTHLPGIDRPLSVRETAAGYEFVYYYVLEQPGHVRGLLNIFGQVTGEYRYAPFGEALPTAAGDGSSQPLRFMGRELDAGTGLYYVRNRWYDPALGRFVSEDPSGVKGGLNTYAYAANDPVNARDPYGLCPSGPALDPYTASTDFMAMLHSMAEAQSRELGYRVSASDILMVLGCDADSLATEPNRKGADGFYVTNRDAVRQWEFLIRNAFARYVDDSAARYMEPWEMAHDRQPGTEGEKRLQCMQRTTAFRMRRAEEGQDSWLESTAASVFDRFSCSHL